MNFKTIAVAVVAFSVGEAFRAYQYEKKIEKLESTHTREQTQTFFRAFKNGYASAVADQAATNAANQKLTNSKEEFKL